MRIPSYKHLKPTFSLLLTMSIAPMVASAATSADFVDPYEDYDESAAFDMELEENLATPFVGAAEKAPIARFMTALARKLKQTYKTVETMREGEVVVVSVPCADLFVPNDTLLDPVGVNCLKPLLTVLKDPDMFKLVYAVHTDDTGSEDYAWSLSSARNQSIYAWFVDVAHINPDQFIINYEMASTMPVSTNNTARGRALNRRVEFFLVPGPKLITLAHNGKLK